MPRRVLPLTEAQCKHAKHVAGGRNRLFDGGGLYLEVTPTGSKLWRWKYRYDGKAQLLALGAYPDVSRQQARKAVEAARQLLAEGFNPIARRKAERAGVLDSTANSFESIAREWFARQSLNWADGYADKVIARLENDVFPWLGGLPVDKVSPTDVLAVLRRLEERGVLETAKRVRQSISAIFDYAIASARASGNPAHHFRGAMTPPPTRHFPAITEPTQVGELLRAIDGYRGAFVTRCALQLAPLVFVRPGELRQAHWAEIDFAGAQWRIPAVRMKLRKAEKARLPPHIVPLSRQSLAILQQLQPLTGGGPYVFPSLRDAKRPMSNNTITAALRRLGYDKSEMVAHGFRHMASTRLHERGYAPDTIERQLAHKAQGVRGIYNRAEHVAERRAMMQEWADYLDHLRNGGGEPGTQAMGAPVGNETRTIIAVAPMPGLRLAVSYADGGAVIVPMAQAIADDPQLRCLLDEALFATVAVADGGDAVTWPTDSRLRVTADSLQSWAQQDRRGA